MIQVLEQQELSSFDFENVLLQSAQRLCFNQPKQYRVRRCVGCNKPEVDVDGNVVKFVYVCGSPYCVSPDCYEHRKKLSKEKFLIYMSAYSTWKKDRDRWLHFSFSLGNYTPEELSKEFLAKRKSDCYEYFRQLQRLGIRIKGVGCPDYSYNSVTGKFHVHLHYALRPIKDFKETLTTMNEIGFDYDIKPVFHGYSKKEWLAEYFSQRNAGRFEHESKQNAWRYSELFCFEDYYKIFHKTRKFLKFGFSRKESKIINIKYQEFSKREAFAITCNAYDTARMFECVFCGCESFKWSKLQEEDYKPPPPNRSEVIFGDDLGFVRSLAKTSDDVLRGCDVRHGVKFMPLEHYEKFCD